MSECENEPVSERESVSGSVFGPEYWFVCECELEASAWLGAAETEGGLPLDDYRGAGSCAGTEAQAHYWRLSVQQHGSPDVKKVWAADSHQGVSKPALEEVVAGWGLGWAVTVSVPVQGVEQGVAALEKASVAVADTAPSTGA